MQDFYAEEDQFYWELLDQTISNQKANPEMPLREAATYAVLDAFDFSNPMTSEDRQISEYTIDEVLKKYSKVQ